MKSGSLFGLVGLVLFARPVLALGSCPIRVEPPAAELDWREEAARIDSKIGALPATDRDCRDILVRVEGRGARVFLTTADERQAVRPVNEPDELEAVISALVVTVPPPPPSEPVAASPVRESERDTPVLQPAPSAPQGAHVLSLAILGGGRAGLSDQLASPSLGGLVSTRIHRFEAGAFGEHEFGYRMLAGTVPNGFALRATSLGVLAGYRHPVAARCVLIGGVRMAAAFVHEQATHYDTEVPGVGDGESEDSDLPVTESLSPIEARLAGYVGVVVPATSRFGIRSEFTLEGVPARWSDARLRDSTLPLLPDWAAGIHLGVEGGIL